MLGVGGLSDFNALHSLQQDDELPLHAVHIDRHQVQGTCFHYYELNTWKGHWQHSSRRQSTPDLSVGTAARNRIGEFGFFSH